MPISMKALAAAAMLFCAAGGARATTLDLGPSAEDYVLYGQGAVSPGVGSFTNQQGAQVFDELADHTTATLSGVILGSSDPSLAAGSYSLVTSFNGPPIGGGGGTEIQSQSDPSNLLYFFYTHFDPSVDMTLSLMTSSGTTTIPLVTDGAFDVNNFNFTYVTATCTGVAVCTQNNVGLTPGATQAGPVTTFVDFDPAVAISAAPEPATWLLLLLSVGGVGLALRKGSRRTIVAKA